DPIADAVREPAQITSDRTGTPPGARRSAWSVRGDSPARPNTPAPEYAAVGTRRALGESRSDRGERPPQVVDQILRILEADGEPHEPVDDPDAAPLLFLDVRMRHRDRVRDQCLDGAEVLGERAEPHRVHQLLAGRDAPFHLEPQHRAEAAR